MDKCNAGTPRRIGLLLILIRFRANKITRAEAGPTAKGSACPREFNPNGGEGIRTPDLLNAIETRSQLRYTPKKPVYYTRTPETKAIVRQMPAMGQIGRGRYRL